MPIEGNQGPGSNIFCCRVIEQLQTSHEMFTRYNAAKAVKARETLEVTMKYRNVGMAKVALITCISLALVGCPGVTQLLQGEAGQQVTVAAPDQTPP